MNDNIIHLVINDIRENPNLWSDHFEYTAAISLDTPGTPYMRREFIRVYKHKIVVDIERNKCPRFFTLTASQKLELLRATLFRNKTLDEIAAERVCDLFLKS